MSSIFKRVFFSSYEPENTNNQSSETQNIDTKLLKGKISHPTLIQSSRGESLNNIKHLVPGEFQKSKPDLKNNSFYGHGVTGEKTNHTTISSGEHLLVNASFSPVRSPTFQFGLEEEEDEDECFQSSNDDTTEYHTPINQQFLLNSTGTVITPTSSKKFPENKDGIDTNTKSHFPYDRRRSSLPSLLDDPLIQTDKWCKRNSTHTVNCANTVNEKNSWNAYKLIKIDSPFKSVFEESYFPHSRSNLLSPTDVPKSVTPRTLLTSESNSSANLFDLSPEVTQSSMLTNTTEYHTAPANMLLSSDASSSKDLLLDSSTPPQTLSDSIHDVAKSLFDGTNPTISHIDTASWLGDIGESNAAVLKEYMSFFNFSDFSILYSMRTLCEKLYMKAESQQLDRIVDAFSERWCECNPNHKLKSVSAVYTLAYSILLLNTDHHSETNQGVKKMQRSQYIQSTLEAMKNLVLAEEKQTRARNKGNSHSPEQTMKIRRTLSVNSNKEYPSRPIISKSDNLALVNDDTKYSQKEWESIVAGILKNIYNSVDMSPLVLAPGKNVNTNSSNVPNTTDLLSNLSLGTSLLRHRTSNSRRNSWMASTDSWPDYNYLDAITKNPSPSSDKDLNTGINRQGMTKEHTIGFAGALWSSLQRDEQEKAKRNATGTHMRSSSIPENIQQQNSPSNSVSFGSIISPTNTRSSGTANTTMSSSVSCKSSLSSINENSLQFNHLKIENKPSTPELREPFAGIMRSNQSTNKNSASTLSLPTAMNVSSAMTRNNSYSLDTRYKIVNEFPTSSLNPHSYSAFSPFSESTMISSSNSEIFSIYERTEPSPQIHPQTEIREEDLLLHGAPWGKEGLLEIQLYMDSTDKRFRQGGSRSSSAGSGSNGSNKSNWSRVFVVVQQGYLRMFRFDKNDHKGSGSLSSLSKSKRHGFGDFWRRKMADKGSMSSLSDTESNHQSKRKTHRHRHSTSMFSKSNSNASHHHESGRHNEQLKQVGSGNWLENATMTDSISLCHTIAQIVHTDFDGKDILGMLPKGILNKGKKPGNRGNGSGNANYNSGGNNSLTNLDVFNNSSSSLGNRDESKKWALLMPDNGVLLFNAGTKEIAEEFVYSCNYWAARVSKEPLLEAVCSSEYGWDKPINTIFHTPRSSKPGHSPSKSYGDASCLSRSGSSTRDSLSHKSSLPSLQFISKHSRIGIKSLNSSASSIPGSSGANGNHQSPNFDHPDIVAQFNSFILGSAHERLMALGLTDAAEALYSFPFPTTPVAADFETISKSGDYERSERSNLPPRLRTESEAASAATAAYARYMTTKSTPLAHHPSFQRQFVQDRLKQLTSYTTTGGLVVIYNGTRYFLTAASNDVLILNNEQINLSKWHAPMASLIMSGLSENAQIDVLNRCAKTIEDAYHNHIAVGALLGGAYKNQKSLPVMPLVFGNWEDKFTYLLKEMMKYNIYLTTLQMAVGDKKQLGRSLQKI